MINEKVENMKRKIIFTILIVIILVNVLEIITSKDTYTYCDYDNWIYLDSYERTFDMLCDFENDEIADLKNAYYRVNQNDKSYESHVTCWEFVAKAEGTTKVYLYRISTLDTNIEELTYDDAVSVITLTVDENNHFVFDRKYDYILNQYENNIEIIIISVFFIIISNIKAFQNRRNRIFILNILLICVYVLNIYFSLVVCLIEVYSLFIIFCIISCIILSIVFSKVYNQNKLLHKFLLWNAGIWLAFFVFSSIRVGLPVIVQVFYLFVIAFILYCCGSKGQVITVD